MMADIDSARPLSQHRSSEPHEPDPGDNAKATTAQLPLFVDALSYAPDTVDFRHDRDAQQYWYTVYRQLIGKFVAQASDGTVDADTNERADAYRTALLAWMDALDLTDSQPISMRTLLDQSGVLLRQHGFPDPWRSVKRSENEFALSQLPERLRTLDAMRDSRPPAEHWHALFRGVFAGNVFDWGAQAVTELRGAAQPDRPFGIEAALQLIQQRPWLFDDFDGWLRRIGSASGAANGERDEPLKAHRCAAVFVDNSGVDIVLGIMPFVRELLRRGTRVILCANRLPSLNDVTCEELQRLLPKCADCCEVLEAALRERRLLVADNGQSGPCLDMRHLSSELTALMRSESVDLLVIEGMGRALLTNFGASFTCDTLKLAVVKNAWWAKRLGGTNFDVICKFEACNTPN